MRQIILDTETTGLSPKSGDRLIEIGCLEMIDRRLTGEKFHVYINPERDVPMAAQNVHGISTEFLLDKPLFKSVAEDFIEFVTDGELIIHNAPFDLGFLNHELNLIKHPWKRLESRLSVLDTLNMARKMHPGQKNNLDALCKRYNINNSHREYHGALLDSEILAEVYLAMTAGQTKFSLSDEVVQEVKTNKKLVKKTVKRTGDPLSVIRANGEELAKHEGYFD